MNRTAFTLWLKRILQLSIILTFSCSVQERNPYKLEIISSAEDYIASVSENSDNRLINLNEYIADIKSDVRYATKNNFTGRKVYPSADLYLRKPVADSLFKVQKELNSIGLTLVIFDAYRPYSVSLKFFSILPDTNYVASPRKASKHNYACAVDVSLAELATGRELDMPTGFDDFTEKAWLNYSNLPAEVLRNRDLLVTVMKKYGFIPYEAEWWHFSYRNWKQFGILDLSFKDLRDFNKYQDNHN